MNNRSHAAIEVDGLVKSYKKTAVLRGVSFSVAPGSVFALLGANGAGKTTMINILTTLLAADDGHARVGGYDVASQPQSVRQSISLTGQFAAVDEVLTARENLVLVAELRHVANPAQTADDLLRQFDLADAADRRTATFSGGMRRRLDIAMSLIGAPSIIFLDEPTTGLDPQSRTAMWTLIKELSAQGTTVFLTTQYLEEADRLADTIAILANGKIVAQGTAQQLKKRLPSGQIELQFDDPAQLAAAQKLFADARPNPDELTLTLATDSSIAQVTSILLAVQKAGIKVAGFSQKTPTLDEAFLQIIEKEEIR